MSNLDFFEKLLVGASVEWKAMSVVAEVRSGWGFPRAYQGQTEGSCPFYKVSDMNLVGNETSMVTAKNYIDDATVTQLGVNLAPAGTIIFPKIGAAIATNKKRLLSFPSAYDNNVMGLIPNERIASRFLFHWMQIVNLSSLASDSGAVPSIRKSDMEKLSVPIPSPEDPEKSLAIQAEIVRILDSFTDLTTELTAELKARKRQYNHYRNQLLSFEDGHVEQAPLEKLARNLDSKRKPITSSLREPGEIPYYGASGVVDYVKDYLFDGDYLLVSEDGANLLARSTPIAFSISGKTWVNNHAHILEFETYAERRFVEYYLNSIDLTPYISGAAQPKLNKKNLNSILIPNPSLEEKKRIVAILDKFDMLTTSLSEGLPCEIKLRQQQYEYYRDLLLSFPKPTDNAGEAA